MFIDKKGELLKEISKTTTITDEKYNVDVLIKLCDSSDIVYSNIPKNDSVAVHKLMFFIRTYNNNLVVKKTVDNNLSLFEWEPRVIPNGITFSDYMLICARDFLVNKMFVGQDPKKIAMSVIPTPFGLIQNKDRKYVAMFQLVFNHELGLELNEDYVLSPIEDVDSNNDNLIAKIKEQFVRTKK